MMDDIDKTVIENGDQQAEQPEEIKTGTKPSGLFANKKKLILFSGIGLAAVALIIVGGLLVFGGDKPSAENGATEESSPAQVAEKPEAKHESAIAHEAEKPKPETKSEEKDEFSEFDLDESELADLDLGLGDDETSAIDQITASLEALDFDPLSENENAAGKTAGMSVEDSTEAVNWLETENSKLAEREKTVTEREKALDKLQREVSKKILVIEQVQSTRVAQLAKLYDGMDPRSVTKLMANLDDDTVVAIISRMKQKNASQVLALISPQRAATLSKKMITIAEN